MRETYQTSKDLAFLEYSDKVLARLKDKFPVVEFGSHHYIRKRNLDRFIRKHLIIAWRKGRKTAQREA